MIPTNRPVPALIQVSWFLLAVSALTLVVFVAGYWSSKVQEAYQQGLADGQAKCPVTSAKP